ncbi:MAG TPA: septum formation family protein, partial [Geodermatophilus sp.]|nr:septum formation family protein [Geodermatophilus sp.]
TVRRGLAGALLALLCGCSGTVAGEAAYGGEDAAKPTVPPAGLGGVDPAGPPVVGTCYTIGEGQAQTPLNPPPPVDCTGEHNAETAVADDSGLGAGAAYPTEAEVGDTGTPIGAAVEQVCSLTVVTDYLGGDELDDPYAYFAPYLPNEEQWAAGARWLRCDVFYGYAEPEPAPGVMAGALTGAEAAAYRVCFVGTPTDYGVVPCSKEHDAEPVGVEIADLPENAPYPDEATRQGLVGSCAEPVEAYVGGPMPLGYVADVWIDSAQEWEAYPYARCVLVPAGGGRTTTSVRG